MLYAELHAPAARRKERRHLAKQVARRQLFFRFRNGTLRAKVAEEQGDSSATYVGYEF